MSSRAEPVKPEHPRLGDKHLHGAVVKIAGQPLSRPNHLDIQPHTAHDPPDRGLSQEPIIEPCAVPDAPAVFIKTKPWHQQEIDLASGDDRAVLAGLQQARGGVLGVGLEVRIEVGNRLGCDGARGPIDPWKRGGLSGGEDSGYERAKIDFVAGGHGYKQQDRPGRDELGESQDLFNDPARQFCRFLSRKCREATPEHDSLLPFQGPGIAHA